jgi:selenocysteine-specific elongation factor
MPDENADSARILSYALPLANLGIETRDAVLTLNAPPAQFKRLFDDKENALSKEYALSGDFVVNLERTARARELLQRTLGDFHAAVMNQPCMKEDALLRAVNFKPKVVLRAVLDSLVNERIIRREADGVALSSCGPSLGKADVDIEQAVLRLFSSTVVAVVLADDIHKLPFKLTDVKRVLARLQSVGVIVRLTQDSFISGKTLNIAKAKLTELLTSHKSIKAGQFRDALGCGRKLAIEVLEYFDKEKVTLRVGDARTLRGV